MDPTQVVSIVLRDEEGVEIVPAPGTVYRMSSPEGNFTEPSLCVVFMDQGQYNAWDPTKTHVVATRYVRDRPAKSRIPGPYIIRHVYGPFTRNEALRVQVQMMNEARERGDENQHEISVHKVIDVDALNASQGSSNDAP